MHLCQLPNTTIQIQLKYLIFKTVFEIRPALTMVEGEVEVDRLKKHRRDVKFGCKVPPLQRILQATQRVSIK